jgi:hypothetical protein
LQQFPPRAGGGGGRRRRDRALPDLMKQG